MEKVTSKNGKVYYKKETEKNRLHTNKYYSLHNEEVKRNHTIKYILENRNVRPKTLEKYNITPDKVMHKYKRYIVENNPNIELYKKGLESYMNKYMVTGISCQLESILT